MTRYSFLLVAVILFVACSNKNQATDDSKSSERSNMTTTEDRSAGVAAIAKADSAWDRVSETKSAEGWLSFYSDDAIMMPPNEKVCKDKASRESSIKNMFATPGVALRFQSTKVDVSAAGDLGYAVGVYQWTSKDSKGADYHETGKYSEIWKKQADGTWKCIVDIWNADAPAKQ